MPIDFHFFIKVNCICKILSYSENRVKNIFGQLQPCAWCCVRHECINMTRRRMLGLMTNVQASRLAQVGRGFLIGQSACRLLTVAREVIDSTHAGHAATSTELLHVQVVKSSLGFELEVGISV